jgi:N-methylhydantoinase A
MTKIVAIDTGGTFTDIVVYDEEIRIEKIFTGKNVEETIERIMSNFQDATILHATTLATNAILTRTNIPKVALLITKGFRDIIEIARQNRPRLYDLFFEKPKPFVDRDMRFEIDERTNYKGEIIKEVNDKELNNTLNEAKKKGAEVLAICFLHSYANPTNEEKTKELAKKYFEFISASYEIAPEPREYERASTTLINAILMPIVSRYLKKFKEVFVMSSSGGLIDKEEAISRPVQIIESGPAAGVIASAELSRFLKIDKAISLDMGGTTAKVSTIINYEIMMTSEYEVGAEVHHGRIVKGSGYPIRFPFIDLAEVSAGGSTIIWRDLAGALKVGPKSAGSNPGPACYNLGGEEPTITDANLLLNRIGEEISGYKLSRELAEKSLKKLGEPVVIAKQAIDLANLEMARAIRLVTVERGLDPSEFSLIAFGGAGPQHACLLAEEIGIKKVIIPFHPGVFSSLGLLFCDEKYEARAKPEKDLESSFQNLERKLAMKLKKESVVFQRYADMRYKGQGWELIVALPKPCSYEEACKIFENAHLLNYGFKLDQDIEIITIRVFAMLRRKINIEDIKYETKATEAKAQYRKVFVEEFEEIPVYSRASLPIGFEIKGPAIIEEYSSSTFIPNKWKAKIIDLGFIELER